MTVLLVVFYLTVFASFLIPLGVAAYCIYRALNDPVPLHKMLWLAGVFAPLLLFSVTNSISDLDQNSRAAQIEKLKRHKVTDGHPDTLIVRGWMSPLEASILLHNYDFARVYVFDDRPHQGVFSGQLYSRDGAAGCSEAAETWLQRKGDTRTGDTLKKCNDKEQVTIAERDLPQDAVVLLLQHWTTLRRSNTIRGHGPYEARLRSNGRDVLLDYWESQVEDRHSSPFCLPIAFICTQPETKVKFIAAVPFLIRALGRS